MKLTLNDKLLCVLLAMQKKRSLLITESQLGLVSNWHKLLHEYYQSLPDELVEGLGLKRNLHCYREIESFNVPEKWLEVEPKELGEFSFGFPG